MSIGGLVVLVVGVPVTLHSVGADPPISAATNVIAHPSRLPDLVTAHFGDAALSKVIWTMAWIVWLWLTVCVAVEVGSHLRGRQSVGGPAGRHVQSVVKWLVTASLAAGFSGKVGAPLRLDAIGISVPAPPGELLVNASVDGTTLGPDVTIEPQVAGPGRQDLTGTTGNVRTYVVRPHDTLWSIAEQELGSPLAWRSIAQANYGRPQPDGGSLTDDHWIRPGWIFVIPPGATRPPQLSSEVVAPPAPASRAPIWPVSRPSSATGIGDMRSGKPKPKPTRPEPTHGGHRKVEGRGGAPFHIPVDPIGFGLLGAGIVAFLERLRRKQQRMRPAGLRIAMPEGDLVELERGLRVGADRSSAKWIDLSMRLLSVAVRRNGITPPTVMALRLRDDAIEVLVDPEGEAQPPMPFEGGEGGGSWLLRRNGFGPEALQVDPEIAGVDAPLPSLVTLGRDETGILMINLETAGSVAISGEGAGGIIEGIVVELATSTWADQIDLLLIGFGEATEKLERVTHAGTLKAAQLKLERRVKERKALLAVAEYGTNPQTRWFDGADPWDLCVVVCAPGLPIEEVDVLRNLVELVGDGSLGVALVFGSELADDVAAARWHVRAHRGLVDLEIGSSVQVWPQLSVQHIPPNLVRKVTSLVAVASNTEGVAHTDGPYEILRLPIPERPTDVGTNPSATLDMGDSEKMARSEPPEVEVRVLGPVEIVGAAREFSRAWATELVVYLVMHPGGVSNDEWATALWPDRPMAPASLHSTASAARRSLGSAASGEDHLPRARGRLELGSGVRSDWDRFVELSRSPAPESWRGALQLIRGRPFERLRAPDWVMLEGILATIEAVVVDLASRFAESCLSRSDARGAEWSARQGLRVSPYDERLYRVLLRAADAAGNPAGVEAIMRELLHLVADDLEPFDAVHPETLALYRRLSRRRFMPGDQRPG